MTTTVVLKNVVKTHGTVRAVDDVSLEIEQGEFFSILGPSGSGKTTLLRLIAGLDVPDQGDIFIQERVMTSEPAHVRPVNLVSQHYALFPHMTVFENVAFGLKMRRQPSQAIHPAVEHMLGLVRLDGKKTRYPGQLSGGEQQRVALARALVNQPVVVLLDEPLAALDQQLRQEMQGELKRLQKEVNATFICVTHQQDEALMLSDRLAIMSGGNILQVGKPQDIYEQPDSSTVAKFIGLSNSLSGTITRVENGLCWVKHEAFPPVVVKRSPQGPDRGPVTVMVRPERLHVSGSEPDKGYANTISATLHHTVFNGNEMIYHVTLPGENSWMARVPISQSLTPPLRVGQTVYLQWEPSEGLALAH